MTEQELGEIEARANAVTQGRVNGDAIVLIAEVRRLRAKMLTLESESYECECGDDLRRCRVCGFVQTRSYGVRHEDWCEFFTPNGDVK